MSDPRITAINQMRDLDQISPQQNKENKSGVSFNETLKSYIDDANDLQLKADKDIQKMIAGEEIDAHEVMTAVEKANMSFEMVMEIRNKMLEAYREIMKTGM
ncbi:MAG: flagellar hook-basal body complex protein FliE [Candidatus Cloacimonetes bacterium]|jgi:flagellar hook-basal body complex protein FliE|nr:flagellar hook-basal body complex protein FliE [Candidatus Cloacimonadota bacterium]